MKKKKTKKVKKEKSNVVEQLHRKLLQELKDYPIIIVWQSVIIVLLIIEVLR